MKENQDFAEAAEALEKLSRTRGRMIWSLSALLLLVLVGSIYLMTSGSEIAAQPISDGASVNLGIIYAASVVIVGAAITAFYVIWANRVVDPLIEKALAARQSGKSNMGGNTAK